jgi:ATP-dependent RNA helicase DeaD
MSIAAWEPGAKGAPTPVKERPRRHSKPGIKRPAKADKPETYAKLVLGGGRAGGLRVADIVGAVTSATDLDGEAVRDVMVLERFSFLSVPEDEAERVIEALDGNVVRDRALSLERVSS